MDLKDILQPHLASAITHGYNDALEDHHQPDSVCQMEAEQNLRNTMADVKKWALEMVGKDKVPYLSTKPDPQEYNQSEFYEVMGENKAKSEVRQRIEESLKPAQSGSGVEEKK